MKKLVFIALIILSLFNSCEDIFDKGIVRAGRYDSSYIYHEFSPELKIETKFDSITKLYFGEDSIDLDLDGNFDAFIIEQSFHYDSLVPVSSNYPVVSSSFSIAFKNGYQPVIEEWRYHYLGRGMYRIFPTISSVVLGTDVRKLQYAMQSYSNYPLWFAIHGGSHILTRWNNIEDKKMYIGIRKTLMSSENRPYYRYGWLEVNATSLENISFTSFAIEQ